MAGCLGGCLAVWLSGCLAGLVLLVCWFVPSLRPSKRRYTRKTTIPPPATLWGNPSGTTTPSLKVAQGSQVTKFHSTELEVCRHEGRTSSTTNFLIFEGPSWTPHQERREESGWHQEVQWGQRHS